MKKNKIIISLFCILCFVILIFAVIMLNCNSSNFEILVENNNICNGKNYYFSHNNKEVYIDCLNSISIKKDGEKYELKDALNKKIVTFDQILKSSKNKIEYWDGGSTIYKYNDFSIITYQREQENDKQCNYTVITSKEKNIDDYCN